MAHLVKCVTVDLSSGHDLTICGVKPHIRLSAESMETSWDSVSLSLTLPISLTVSKQMNFKHENYFMAGISQRIECYNFFLSESLYILLTSKYWSPSKWCSSDECSIRVLINRGNWVSWWRNHVLLKKWDYDILTTWAFGWTPMLLFYFILKVNSLYF